MVRTRLRNKFLKSKTNESREAYKKQRNYCVSLLRETKRCFYENLNPEFISDNKKFWMQVKPFFSDKTPPNSKIMLEGEEIISDSSKCAELVNNFFSDAAINLDIDRELHTEIVPDGINDPVTKAIVKYKCHPSIIKIEEQVLCLLPSIFFQYLYWICIMKFVTLTHQRHTKKIIYHLNC